MAPSPSKLRTAGVVASAGFFLIRGAAAAGFNGNTNIALYWGQNSFGQGTGDLAQQPLATYCRNSDVDIIPMAFLVQVTSGPGDEPVINFANSGNGCTLFPGTGLLDCPDIGEDIKTCQSLGKTILLSIGGATYTEGGFSSEAAAEAAAELVWRTFGPVNNGLPGTNSSTSSLLVSSSTVFSSSTLFSTSAISTSSLSTSVFSSSSLLTSALSTTGLTSSISTTDSTSSSLVTSSTASSVAVTSSTSTSTSISSTVTSSTTATSSMAEIPVTSDGTTTTPIPDSSINTSTFSPPLTLTDITSLTTTTRIRTPCSDRTKTTTASPSPTTSPCPESTSSISSTSPTTSSTSAFTSSTSPTEPTLSTITPSTTPDLTVIDTITVPGPVFTTFQTTLVTLVITTTLSPQNLAVASAAPSVSTFTTVSTLISTATSMAPSTGTPSLSRRQSTPETLRPFHDAVIDGFDLDLESETTNFKAFALRLRALMATDTSKSYYLTAAPQCPYPDIATNDLLNGNVTFDAIFVQFYNNYCGVNAYVPASSPDSSSSPTANQQNAFNFATWNDWAMNGGSQNKNVKVFLGVPAGPTAAGSGYLTAEALKPVIQYAKGFASFGGVMAWDASQAGANEGWLAGVKSALTEAASKARRFARQWKA